MRIKDVERLLDSHARLIAAVEHALGTSRDDARGVLEAYHEMSQAMLEARKVREQIGRALP